MEIRIAQEEDVPYLLDIYNYEVLHGEATFDINPRTLSERLDWYYAHNISNHPRLWRWKTAMPLAMPACLPIV